MYIYIYEHTHTHIYIYTYVYVVLKFLKKFLKNQFNVSADYLQQQ